MVLIGDAYNTSETGLIVWLRSALEDDDDLMDDVKDIYHVWAEKDAELPYITFRAEIDETMKAVQQGTLFLGLWDYAQTSQRIMRIKGNVIRILDRLKVGYPESYTCRFFHSHGGFVPAETENIWHREEMFNIRFDRKVEVENIISRSD